MPVTRRSQANKPSLPQVKVEEVKPEPNINLQSVKLEPEILTAVKKENVKQEPKDVKPEVDNGQQFWELGRNRRLYFSNFKGVEYLHIRSMYINDETGKSEIRYVVFIIPDYPL